MPLPLSEERAMNRWITQYCRVLAFLMVLCLATMVVLVFTNVVLRYAFSSGITISEEFEVEASSEVEPSSIEPSMTGVTAPSTGVAE